LNKIKIELKKKQKEQNKICKQEQKEYNDTHTYT